MISESRRLSGLVGVRLTPDDYERGWALAHAEGTTLPALIRDALRERLDRETVTEAGGQQ